MKQNSTQSKTLQQRRIDWIVAFFIFFAIAIVVRLFYLQIIRYDDYVAKADDQRVVEKVLEPMRGDIFMRDQEASGQLLPLATTIDFDLVYAVPESIENAYATATILSDVLGYDSDRKEKLIAQLSKEKDKYELIQEKISKEVSDKIKTLNLTGIYIGKEKHRFYPEGELASNILGFVGWKDEKKKGMYGIEGYFDEELSGKPGEIRADFDAKGRIIGIADNYIQRAQDGDSIVLTIDKYVQEITCKHLTEAIQTYQAESGAVVVMDPYSGAILAICSYPTFDPNNYSQVTSSAAYNNNGVYMEYEPGSIFKPITLAASMNEGKIEPSTTYTDTGVVELEEFKIKNAGEKAYGVQTMTEVLEKSLNTGAIFAAEKLGRNLFREYVERFGFGTLSGIQMNSEHSGDIRALSKKSFIFTATASFGQGITATPLQMVTAFSVFANGGKLVKPYIVDEIIKSDGSSEKTEPVVVREVISSDTAAKMSAMLVSSVQSGYAKLGAVDGYNVAGKTGTAQIYNPATGKYYDDIYNSSYVGFAPVNNPKFAMITFLGKPQLGKFGNATAAPLFGQIAKEILQYYQVSY